MVLTTYGYTWMSTCNNGQVNTGEVFYQTYGRLDCPSSESLCTSVSPHSRDRFATNRKSRQCHLHLLMYQPSCPKWWRSFVINFLSPSRRKPRWRGDWCFSVVDLLLSLLHNNPFRSPFWKIVFVKFTHNSAFSKHRWVTCPEWQVFTSTRVIGVACIVECTRNMIN